MPPQNLERPFIFQKIKKKTKKNNIGSVVGKTDVQIAASFFFVCFIIHSTFNLCLHEMLLLSINCSFKASVYE